MIDDASARARDLLDDGLAVPLPGASETRTRWGTLRELCHVDIAVGRLVEAHFDADAILHELTGRGTEPGEFWGVWAAEPPVPRVTAELRRGGRWLLTGAKPWCSGVLSCDHALITADVLNGGGERRMFAVELGAEGVRREPADWTNAGMNRTETGTVVLDGVVGRPVGERGAYLDRAGFWHGGIGVAACWVGGTQKVADVLYAKASSAHSGLSDILLMHLGAVEAEIATAVALLDVAACEVDANPSDIAAARRRAFCVRWSVEQRASAVIDRVGRALGPGPLVHDAEHAQAVADLQVYVRQSHADSDLASLGALVVERARAAR
ncbi:acyl-CoA dehydrogenase [Gordonia sp. 852002-50816_SCH5313054-c]|uniref:acyl-CoA dehydrogenase family protein n=1 Tax=unclassified Gordonia (in: high G+C Gram-positive bacteria) TaxID=2657482 RepID=UPI0007E9CC14|nr:MULTISPECIES: acyl-CoA dehydrogenase family protein [unclassified Gordonia (in: high G+C Gram-positive bacteria)]OBC15128.1 acyl-CoA dehydrogenase [Gordonia sp. 852002-50816_SCH5313054-c]OBC18313.1 acyl-CoA dehydrogenase [Gordonia sp. 852002-50816_SCH5313054-a]